MGRPQGAAMIGQAPSMEEHSWNWIAPLRAFARISQPVHERCERCGCTIAPDHPHLLEAATRRLVCTCSACAARAELDSEGLYRRVPDEVRLLADFSISEDQWDALGIPIGLAFFFTSRAAPPRSGLGDAGGMGGVGGVGRVSVMYPGAAGAVESLLALPAWEALVSSNRVLESLLPDVEALLAYRLGGARHYYIAPIDRCYALAGLTRTHWRGISGGTAVWDSIEDFFAELHREARVLRSTNYDA